MGVLTRDAILAELEAGRLVVTPFEMYQLGASSIDLTLGDEIRVIDSGADPIDVRAEADYRDHTTLQRLDAPYVLDPGCTIHGITRERIALPSDLCGLLEGRSRFARLGLAVHVTAGFMQPGIANRQVLEMVNMGHTPLAVYPQTKICQMIFIRCEGKARYRGRFRAQKTP